MMRFTIEKWMRKDFLLLSHHLLILSESKDGIMRGLKALGSQARFSIKIIRELVMNKAWLIIEDRG